MSDLTSSGGFTPPPAGYPPGHAPLAPPALVPWEDPSRGILGRWCGTTKGVLVRPGAFFAAAAENGSPWPAVSYALVTIGVTAVGKGVLLLPMAERACRHAPSALEPSQIAILLGVSDMRNHGFLHAFASLILAVLAPVVFAGLAHVTLRLSGAATRPYASTARVFAYAAACHLWALTPIGGSLLALGMGAGAAAAGLSATHRCSKAKAALAVLLLPAIGLFALAFGSYLLLPLW